MTQREFYAKVIATEGISEELKTYAEGRIEALDKANANRSSKPTKKQTENEPIKEKIVAYLGEHPKTVGLDLAEAIGENKSTVISLCTVLVKEGKLTKEEVKIPKVGKRMAYSLAEVEETEVEEAEVETETE